MNIELEAYSKEIGILIRMNRIKKGYSLRQFADLAMISHTHISNIEIGKIVPNINTIKELFKILDIDFTLDKEISKEFHELFNKLYMFCYKAEFNEAKAIIKQIVLNKSKYEYSTFSVDYKLTLIAYDIFTNSSSYNVDFLLDQLENVFFSLNSSQQQLFHFFKGVNHYNKREAKLAIDNLLLALDFGGKNITKLGIKFYLAKSYSRMNNSYKSITLFKEAAAGFDSDANYARSIECMLGQAIDFSRMRRFDEAYKLYMSVMTFAKKYKDKKLENDTLLYLTSFYIRKNDYDSALDCINNCVPRMSERYYFYKVYTHYKREEYDLCFNYINSFLDLDQVHDNIRLVYLLEVLRYQIKPRKNLVESYEEKLIFLIKQAEKSHYYELLEMSYGFYIDFLRSKRNYKKALEYATKLLDKFQDINY
ncbi:hypothetical protein CI105_06960 [Candidatus Izimaplasma bacterium ZiA1]|uniref:helix-turn-helix domain-containing protein n=1 Tax=Candidatus Izimoplasma sp. ZiA1 TaxID=2024899 RepID=UPI000BAA8C79|nr:hypothetical protein CI105_06960 [Candidatus Izimaplasma bacterium ZiA1]